MQKTASTMLIRPFNTNSTHGPSRPPPDGASSEQELSGSNVEPVSVPAIIVKMND